MKKSAPAASTSPAPKGPTMEELIARINDNPDAWHGNLTPAVDQLIDRGLPAVSPVLALMLSDDRLTRLRAETVLDGITSRLYGFVPGHGWPSRGAEERHRCFWRSLGDLGWEGDRAAREEGVRRWRQWVSDGYPR